MKNYQESEMGMIGSENREKETKGSRYLLRAASTKKGWKNDQKRCAKKLRKQVKKLKKDLQGWQIS